MSTYDPANWFPATQLTPELSKMFKDAAFDDGLLSLLSPRRDRISMNKDTL